MGKRISPYNMIDKDPKMLTTRELNELAEQIRKEMQSGLNEAVKQYGKKPYNFSEIVKLWFKAPLKKLFSLPLFWPFIFAEHDRLFYKKKREKISMKESALTVLKSFIFNFSKIIFFIPILGWIPVLLIGLKKQE